MSAHATFAGIATVTGAACVTTDSAMTAVAACIDDVMGSQLTFGSCQKAAGVATFTSPTAIAAIAMSAGIATITAIATISAGKDDVTTNGASARSGAHEDTVRISAGAA